MEIAQESSQIALLVARRQLQARKQSGFFEAVGGAWQENKSRIGFQAKWSHQWLQFGF